MNENESNQENSARPYWMPDTQGFLAIGILLLIFMLVLVLIYGPSGALKPEVLAVLTTLVGVLVGSLNTVYNYFFPGSKDLSGNSDAIKKIALAPEPPRAPAPPDSTTTTTTKTTAD